jgi:hypothetical protein
MIVIKRFAFLRRSAFIKDNTFIKRGRGGGEEGRRGGGEEGTRVFFFHRKFSIIFF